MFRKHEIQHRKAFFGGQFVVYSSIIYHINENQTKPNRTSSDSVAQTDGFIWKREARVKIKEILISNTNYTIAIQIRRITMNTNRFRKHINIFLSILRYARFFETLKTEQCSWKYRTELILYFDMFGNPFSMINRSQHQQIKCKQPKENLEELFDRKSLLNKKLHAGLVIDVLVCHMWALIVGASFYIDEQPVHKHIQKSRNRNKYDVYIRIRDHVWLCEKKTGKNWNEFHQNHVNIGEQTGKRP